MLRRQVLDVLININEHHLDNYEYWKAFPIRIAMISVQVEANQLHVKILNTYIG